MILADPVNLLCNLIEARVGSFEASALPDQWGGSIDFFVEYWRGNERETPFSPDVPRLPR